MAQLFSRQCPRPTGPLPYIGGSRTHSLVLAKHLPLRHKPTIIARVGPLIKQRMFTLCTLATRPHDELSILLFSDFSGRLALAQGLSPWNVGWPPRCARVLLSDVL